MDDLLPEFLSETAENLEIVDQDLVKFEQDPSDAERLGNIFRLVHTVKGSCGFIGLARLERVAHAAETLLGRLRDGELTVNAEIVSATLDAIDCIRGITDALAKTGAEPEGDDERLIARLEALADRGAPVPKGEAGAQDTGRAAEAPDQVDPAAAPAKSIRVSVDLLEELVTSVSELVLTRNQLTQERRQKGAGELDIPLQRLSAQIGRLQDSVMRTRMQPISGALNILPRMVRQLGVDLGKQIELSLNGGTTELDRQMLELVKDPLAHMIRNAADHGLESPEARRAAGKPPTGTIRVDAVQEGGHITITIADDGRGLNYAALRRKAVERGEMSAGEAKNAGEAQLARTIFTAGLSTAENVTSVSGRGVGMDVVRANIERIGGTVEVESREGRGTTFRLRIPLTLAIMPALIVGIGEDRFAVPQLAVSELVRSGGNGGYRIERVGDARVIRLRGQLLPILSLAESFGEAPGVAAEPNGDEGGAETHHILVLRAASMSFGLIVDEIFDTEELVVKPVSRPLADLPFYSGNAILGDGGVIMILDPNGLAANAAQVPMAESTPETDMSASESDSDAMLIFRADGDDRQRAVPLALVSRIEDIESERIERSGDGAVVQLREGLVPLVTPGGALVSKSEGRQQALVFRDQDTIVAVAVDEVIDIVDAAVSLEIASNDPGRLGTAVIAGKATELIDVAHLLSQYEVGASMSGSVGGGEAPRVLVVDDSPFFRNMLKPLLAAAGYRVTTAPGVTEALSLRSAGERFDMILSDIEMPGRTGLDFARDVRAGGDWSATPLIALSSRSKEEDMNAGMEAGFDRYVAKFDRQRLLGLLETSLRNPPAEKVA